MFINEVISYNGAFELLDIQQPRFIEQLDCILKDIENSAIKLFYERKMSYLSELESEIFKQSLEKLEEIDCIYKRVSREFAEDTKECLIYRDQILIDYIYASSELIEWVYGGIFFNFKFYDLSIAVMLYENYTSLELYDFFKSKIEVIDDFNFHEDAIKPKDELEKIGTKNISYPLLILGIDLKKENRNITHIEPQNIKVNRCITFAPEYYQAGLSILNYFGTVLRNKYPEQNATVKIEQHENVVRMIVESENGDKEIIEKALYEYELVMSGQTSVEAFYQDPIQTLELRNQIRILQFQVESQREIFALKNGQIQTLNDLLQHALKQPQAPLSVNNYLNNQQTVNIHHKHELNQSYAVLDELIDTVQDESLKNQLRDLQNALDQSKNLEQAAQVKDSSGFKKLSKFMKQANDTTSDVHGILDKSDKAIGLVAKLNEHYEKLVQFTTGLI